VKLITDIIGISLQKTGTGDMLLGYSKTSNLQEEAM
jgi:hypothetical protein